MFKRVMMLAVGLSLSTASADEVVRIMAANTTSGNGQDYDPGEGIRIFQGLDPDIVLIQEFNYLSNTSTNFRNFVDTAFSPEFQYFREPGDEQIPNGIISRYPILQSGEWVDSEVSNRDFAWAKIDIPGDKDLWAVSVHFLTTSSGNRNAQATALVNFIQSNVPAADYLVIGGDFNTSSFSESALSALSAVVNTSGRPDDQNGTTGTNASRSSPYDQVLPDPDLNSLETPVTISGHSFTYADGLVFDSRVFTPISAVAPVNTGDSGASGMQHMAVIRDFLIPTNSVPAEPASHVTNFAGSSTTNSISLSWTDSVTTPGATGYLVKASTTPTITPPVDGVVETPDGDLSDGSAALLVPTGQQTATFAGLPVETTCYFEIYPYAGGTPVNYKTDGQVPSLTIATLPDSAPLPAAPVLAGVYYPHAGGFTITWDEVPGATEYRLDVSESPTFSGASSTVLTENFDASVSVPTGWVNGGTANDVLASHYRSASNCRALGVGDTLVTPAVDFPGEISFYVDASNGGNGMSATISYSVNNGSWTLLDTFTASTSGNPESIGLTVSPKLDDVANVRFRFESSFNTWYLDDVTVTSSSSPGFVAGYQDRSVGNTCHHAVSGLNPDTAYYFRVRAVNATGAGPSSATGSETTRLTGTPFMTWASDHGIAPADFTSDYDKDSLTDFEEYLFATDPKVSTSPAVPIQLSTEDDKFQITFRRSLAPDVEWIYQGGADLSLIDAALSEGVGYAEYEMDSVVRAGNYEQVVLKVNTGGDPKFFFRVKATVSP